MTRSPSVGLDRSRRVMLAVRWVGMAIVAGSLLAILGPFGSYMNGGPVRLLTYWIGAVLLGLALYGAAYRIVSALTAIGSRRWWLTLIGATLLASIPEALATRMAAFRLWPELARFDLSFALWFAQTATIGVIAMAGVGVVRLRSASVSHGDPVAPPSVDPIATPLGREVLALQMEDHYVRVYRPAGSELILMPLGRAIEAVKADGLRTHRSWWVAAHAVTAVEGNARSMRLRLSNGLVAPVARSAVTHLKTARVDQRYRKLCRLVRTPIESAGICQIDRVSRTSRQPVAMIGGSSPLQTGSGPPRRQRAISRGKRGHSANLKSV